jgi:hypothetical protein
MRVTQLLIRKVAVAGVVWVIKTTMPLLLDQHILLLLVRAATQRLALLEIQVDAVILLAQV